MLDSTVCDFCNEVNNIEDDFCVECGELLFQDSDCDYFEDDEMDGDWDSAMKSAGFGTDEDYNYGVENDVYY